MCEFTPIGNEAAGPTDVIAKSATTVKIGSDKVGIHGSEAGCNGKARLTTKKLAGPEKAVWRAADVDFHAKQFDRLVCELEQAASGSKLPEQATGKAALNDLLIRMRLGDRMKYVGQH